MDKLAKSVEEARSERHDALGMQPAARYAPAPAKPASALPPAML